MKATTESLLFLMMMACSDSSAPETRASGTSTTSATGSGGTSTSGGAGSTSATSTGGATGTGSTTTTGPGGSGGAGGGSDGGAGGATQPDAGGGSGGGVKLDSGVDAAREGSPPSGGHGPAGGTCPSGVMFGNPLPQNKTATLLKSGFGELEGPAWVDSQKALYFCEMGATSTTGRIHKYTPADGKFTVFVENVGVGGLALDPEGMLVAGSYDKRRLTRFDPATAQRTDVPGSSVYMGTPFNEVNDVVVRSDGNVYFSDPNYARPQGTLPMAFYRLSPAPQSAVTRILTASDANGVALSPDGNWLYLSTTGGPALQRVALAADGSIMGNPATWNDPTSDGMAVDCAGNVYLSVAGGTNQIRVVSPTDQLLGAIVGLGGGYVTNGAFGDDDHKTLYITTSTSLYKIALNVPGFPN